MKSVRDRFFLIFSCWFLLSNSIHAQTIKIKGKVTDSLQNPLAYANVVAEPKVDRDIKFSITDDQGNYELRLDKNETYLITYTFLGYKPVSLNIIAQKDSILNVTLKDKVEVLDEVKIDAKLAVSIRKDTITYLTDKFTTGEERKLRDVLKKLPGVEVDKVGNVIVQGKKVTKVLVEDKQFFTGDSKLAVNNIPADVVNEIEILDNYSDVAILKGLEDSDDMAMNIKLKEGKKKFWFGDIETSYGFEERHLLHPSLFYYSPKTSINVIGDFNNIGKKSFTFKDYLDFEGGYNKILLNPKAYFSRLNDDFSQFLNDRNFKDSDHLFGGFNVNQSINNSTELVGYTIYSQSKNQLENQNILEYVSDVGSLIENRTVTRNPDNQFIISKLALEKGYEDDSELKIQFFLKASENQDFSNTSSFFDNTRNFINTTTQADNFNIKLGLEWYKRLSDSQIFTTLINYNYSKGNNLINWLADDMVFQEAIPIIDDITFNIFNDKETRSSNFAFLVKHYWVLGNFIHLYTTLGADTYSDTLESNEFQLLSNGQENNFSSSGFGNNIDFDFDDYYMGLHLKFQTGKFTFKPGIFFHSYHRLVKQINERQILEKSYILPEVLIKGELKRSVKITFRYNRKVRFPSVLRLADNLTLTNFNSIYTGDSSLENELYHQASIHYYKFNLFRKLNYNVRVTYRKTEKGIKNRTLIENINFITQPILINNSDESINMSGRLSKGYGKIDVSLNGNFSKNNFLQVINDIQQKNNSESFSIGTRLRTKFSNFPNFTVNYSKSFNNYTTPVSLSKFENDNLDFFLEYNFGKNFIFKLDYNYQRFNNLTVNSVNNNDILNTSLNYSREKSPWSFEISANNIFNNQFIRNNSFSDFLISDTRTFVLPRIIMFKLSYKL